MTRKLVSNKNHVAGWLDCTIHDFLDVFPSDEASTRYALISCLDSNPNPASLRMRSPELKPIANKLQELGTGLLLPTEFLLETNSKNRIFFGFDEIWLFPERPREPKPGSLTVVGPARIERAGFRQISKWMLDNSCSMALGGGEGLNFIVSARGLAKILLGCSIEQPEPSLTQP